MEDRIELKKENEELKKTFKNCENKLRDRHDQIKNLVKGASQLEREINDLRAQSKHITKANKQKIIDEYKTSPELTRAVVDQFDKGYQLAKAKIKAAGFDSILLDFSDDEEKDPPILLLCCHYYFCFIVHPKKTM